MSTQTIPAEQQNVIDKLLKDLEFKGFKPDFHKENISKAVMDGKENFSLKDQSFSKKVDFTINYTKNRNGNYQLSVLGHHKEKGTYAKFPLQNAFPRKDVFENFLDLKAFQINIDKWSKEENKFIGQETVWLTMKENPCMSAEAAEKMWNHTKSYNHKFFSIKEDYFAHSITPQEKKDLEKGRVLAFDDCVNLKTGEVCIVTGIHANPAKQKLSYGEMKGTGVFLEPAKLVELQARYKKAEPASEQNQEEAQENKKSTRRKIA